MGTFDPTSSHFIKLQNFEFPGGISVYEYNNHPQVNGEPDFVRLNLYLSKDGEFVTIWFGLLEPIFTESKLESVGKPADFDFRDAYVEELFKGYIDTQEVGAHILKALRVDSSRSYAAPQMLSADSDNQLRCDVLN